MQTFDEVARARAALFHLDAGCSRGEWVRLLMAAKAAGVSFEDALEWSSSGGNFDGEPGVRDTWKSIKAGAVGAGTLFHAARAAGWHDDGRYSDAPLRVRPVTPIEPEDPQPEILSDSLLAYWNRLGPVDGVARAYLQARGCAIPPSDGDLRFDPRCKHYPSEQVAPALVALVTDVGTRTPINLHKTWINVLPDGTVDGSKAPLEPPRRYLKGHRKAGGVIRLWPDESVTTGLGVAEGIESALALALRLRPVWALLDAGNLGNFPPLPSIEALTIFYDRDPEGTGERNAHKCAGAWTNAGHDVYLA